MAALQARAAGSATRFLRLVIPGDRNRQNLNHQNRFKNDRKIALRRRRRANLCNKLALYHEYTWKVNQLDYEPRAKNPHRCALITKKCWCANWPLYVRALLAFYEFPAEHWKHLRMTNPIESTFATVRHRTIRSKGCLSNKTALAMVFKLVDAAPKKLAPDRRPQPVAKTDPGCEVHRRDRGHRHFCRASSRLILQAVTKIWR